MGSLLRDGKHGLRLVRRRPGFALAAIASLVLGIGLNTAVFSLLDEVFARPLPVEDLETLTTIYGTRRSDGGPFSGLYNWSYPDFRDLRENSRSFESMAAFQWYPMNFAGGAEPIRAKGMFATAEYFSLLGLEPHLGRFFLANADEVPGEPREVVLSYSSWRRHFGADPAVLDRTVRVNGETFQVVGVGPERFRGTVMTASIDFWLPMTTYPVVGPYGDWFEVRGTGFFVILGKLRTGVGPEQAEAEMMALSAQLEERFPKEMEGIGARVRPLRDNVFVPGDQARYQGYARTLRWASALILLVCGLNVAHLLVVNGLGRRQEIALRQAIGAPRGRIARQMMAESLVIFGLGGLLALPAAGFLLQLLWSFRPPQLPADALALALDSRVFVFAFVTTAVSGMVFGALPAWWASRIDLVGQLRLGTRTGTPGGLTRWLGVRRLLVIGQVALAVVAMFSAGLFLRALQSTHQLDLGYATESLLVVSLAPGEAGLDEETTRGFYERLVEEVSALPGVAAASLSENRLLRGAIWQQQVFWEGSEEAAVIGERASHRTNAVIPGFFETVGIELLEGRDFSTSLDRADTPPVAIINRTMAATAWPGEDPIGRRFTFDYPDHQLVEVVGVVEDTKYRHVREPEQFFIYLPLAQRFSARITLHVRAEEGVAPTALLEPVRRQIRTLAPELPLADASPLNRFVAEDLWLDRVSTSLLAAFGLLALALAAVGIYGVLAQFVDNRKREFGIRLSLGAGRVDLLRQLAVEVLALLGLGTLLGAGLTWALLRLGGALQAQLSEVRAGDPMTLGAVLLLLVAAAALGGWLPWYRAVSTDPASALRES